MSDMTEEFEFNIDKEKDFSNWYTEILQKAELVDQRYPIKGLVVHMPNMAATEKIIFDIYEKELEKEGHKRGIFPSLIRESDFKLEKDHIKGFNPEVFWVTESGSQKFEERLGLRPTSEIAMYQMYKLWIRSWRDLPLKLYNSCTNVWRFETKATRPLLRDREFTWIEAHDAFETKQEAEEQVMKDISMSERVIHQQFGVPIMCFRRTEWDKFAGAEYTFAADVILPDGKILQLPSTHLLGTHFSKVFDIKYKDEKENEKLIWQTCYGPGISRIYAAILATHGDNKGVVMPFEIASVQVVIIPIVNKDSEKQVLDYCQKLLAKIKELGIRAELDSSEKRPGFKFNEWELKGAALRFEVGEKELKEKSITVVRRDNREKSKVAEKDIDTNFFKKISDQILQNLKSKADQKFKSLIHDARSMKEIKEGIAKGGFVRINFCSREKDGKACEEKIRAETAGAEVRGNLHDRTEKAEGNCVICGKKASIVMYVAKSY